MKRKKNKPRKQVAGRPMLQIKTTIDFGEDGIPLERLGEITKLLKERHLGAQGRGALCLWSVHLGDRIGRGRRRMLYLHYRRGVAR
jgi:hypothetical protein